MSAAHRSSKVFPGGVEPDKLADDASGVTKGSMTVEEQAAKGREIVKKSLWIFPVDNPVRQACLLIATSVWFDRFILLFIIANSIFLAIPNYEPDFVDDDYQPRSDSCERNHFVAIFDPVFTWVFFSEAVIKIVALGFTAYIKDGWNRLDFLVVTIGVLEIFPFMPQLSMLRTFRILRPLRSLSKFPGLRRVISAMLNSLPGLLDVVLLLCFMLAVFSILGIQFFGGEGLLHGRCRVTAWPVKLGSCLDRHADCWPEYIAEMVANQEENACVVDETGKPVANDDPNWKRRKDSPWAIPRDCVWPVDEDDTRVCSRLPKYSGGWHQCPNWPGDVKTCGSNYDWLGNPRFIDSLEPYGYPRLDSGTFNEDLNWGFTVFDHFGKAILTVFQSVTVEGWTDVMYMCMDAYNPVAASCIFVMLILLGSFVMLNLVLAVITESISEADEEAEKEKEEALRQKEIKRLVHGEGSSERKIKDEGPPSPLRLKLLALVESSLWTKVIMAFILANTVALAMDRYPASEARDSRLEQANLVFTIVFAFEMAVNMGALGIQKYVNDPFNNFDAVIVMTSLFELLMAIISDGGGAGGVSALRTFRLFRVFKLAKGWKSLQNLLEAMKRTVLQVGNFAVLLFLFIYIYGLVGLQFFSNRLHFDSQTGAPIAIRAPGYDEAEIPRANFDSFMWSVVTVFQVLTGENWNAVMYDCWRASNWVAPLYFLSLVILGGFIVMNIFLAILLSNFEGNEDLFQTDSTEKIVKVGDALRFMHRMKNAYHKDKAEGDEETGTATAANSPTTQKKTLSSPLRHLASLKSRVQESTPPFLKQQSGLGSNASKPAQKGEPCRDLVAALTAATVAADGDADAAKASNAASTAGASDRVPEKKSSMVSSVKRRVSLAAADVAADVQSAKYRVEEECEKIGDALEMPQEKSNSLWIFKYNSQFRVLCTKMVTHKAFESLILYLIIISSALLAADNPLLDPAGGGVKVLKALDIIFTYTFLLEAVLKIISLGFLLHKGAYLREPWNQLDFFIVCVSVISVAGLSDGGGLKALRTVRVLRPLRMIGRNPELKTVVDALLASIPAILNVSVICVLFFLVFAVMGVTYLKGAMGACGSFDDFTESQQNLLLQNPLLTWGEIATEYPDALSWFDTSSQCTQQIIAASAESPTSREICTCLVGEDDWVQVVPQSFDHVFLAMGCLYEISTTEGWVDVMYAAIDQRGIDMQPIKNWNVRDYDKLNNLFRNRILKELPWIGFFVTFMIFGAFFIMNLFVGVIIDNFNRIKSSKGAVFQTKEQEEWQKMQRIVQKIKPKRVYKPPKGSWRMKCYELMMSPSFDPFIVGCIVCNSLIMATQHYGEVYAFTITVEWLNYLFALIFTCEAAIKISAIGHRYFDEGWNRFDFTIVVGTITGLLVKLLANTDVGTVASVIRVFRLGRILRLINSAKSLRQLFNTLVTSLPSFSNIAMLLFLLFFIYAVLGVQLFAKVASNDDYNVHANFRSFWVALLTLFRFSTGENWNGYMHSLTEDAPGCVPDPVHPVAGVDTWTWCEKNLNNGNCQPINGCGSWVAFPFFYSFTLVVTFVMLNLFIGVILDSFSACDEDDNLLTPQHFEIFVEDWAKFDPEGTCFIELNYLADFIQILDAPLGFGEDYEASLDEVRQRIQEMDIKMREGVENKVHFTDVANALAKRVALLKFGNQGGFLDMEQEKKPAPDATSAIVAAELSKPREAGKAEEHDIVTATMVGKAELRQHDFKLQQIEGGSLTHQLTRKRLLEDRQHSSSAKVVPVEEYRSENEMLEMVDIEKPIALVNSTPKGTAAAGSVSGVGQAPAVAPGVAAAGAGGASPPGGSSTVTASLSSVPGAADVPGLAGGGDGSVNSR